MSSNTATFDTLKYTKKLKAAGVPEKQAEAHAEGMKELIDEKLATKEDLRLLEYRLTIRLGSMMATGFAFVSILIAVMKFI